MRQVELIKYVRPDEADKWWNRQELREICINADEVEYIDKKMSSYYDISGGQTEAIVTVIHMKNGDIIDIEGEYKTILDKVRGGLVK